MGELFVSKNDVVNASVAKKLITAEQKAQFGAYLDELDIAIDGKLDGGFYDSQLKFGKFSTEAKQIVNSLLRNKIDFATRPDRPQEDSAFVIGGKFLLSFLMLTTPGCDARDYHPCINPDEPCPSGPTECWYDDQHKELCDCITGYTEQCDRYGCDCVEQDNHYDKY